MKRSQHLFQFKAEDIAAAAKREAAYHRERLLFWQNELDKATDRVAQTAEIKIERAAITGGWRPVVNVNYGDTAAYSRMNEAATKINSHTSEAERFETAAALYGTQAESRTYELDEEDVHALRLAKARNRED